VEDVNPHRQSFDATANRLVLWFMKLIVHSRMKSQPRATARSWRKKKILSEFIALDSQEKMSQQSQSEQTSFPITGRGLAGQPLLQPSQPGKPGLPQHGGERLTRSSPPEQTGQPKPEEPAGHPHLPKPGELEPGKPQILTDPTQSSGLTKSVSTTSGPTPEKAKEGTTKIFFQGEEPTHEPMQEAYKVFDEKEVKKQLEKEGEIGEQIFAEPVTPGETTYDTAGLKAAESAQDIAEPMK